MKMPKQREEKKTIALEIHSEFSQFSSATSFTLSAQTLHKQL